MKIGFTGTQVGMTQAQKAYVAKILSWYVIEEIHHGDCIGADEDFHKIVEYTKGNLFPIVVHPPKNPVKRAFCTTSHFREPKEYLERNKDIVKETDWIIATPKEFKEVLRSGTWSTIRYAKKKCVLIVFPDATTQYWVKNEIKRW